MNDVFMTCNCPRCGGQGYISLVHAGDDIQALKRRHAALCSELKSLTELIRELERDARYTNRTYFISDGEAVKIGVSVDPETRLRTLQTGHPKKLVLLGVCSAREDELHERFKGLRLNGEWFELTPELEQFIQQSIRRCEWKAETRFTD